MQQACGTVVIVSAYADRKKVGTCTIKNRIESGLLKKKRAIALPSATTIKEPT